MTGLLIALTLAVWSTLCIAAGFALCLHRNAPQLARLAADERATQRDREFRQAAPWWQEQIDRNRAHTLAATR